MGSSAVKGDGLVDAMHWLVDALAATDIGDVTSHAPTKASGALQME